MPAPVTLATCLWALVYNALQRQAVLVDTGGTRAAGQVSVVLPQAWAQNDEDALFGYVLAYRVTGSLSLQLSGSSVQKVNANAFVMPEPDVPPATSLEDVPFGQGA